MLLNESANCLHTIGFPVAAHRLGAAAQARTVSCLFRRLGRGKELNILPAGTPRRTRGTAVHTGGGHGKNEFAVVLGITRHYGAPPRIIYWRGRRERLWLTDWHKLDTFRCEYGIRGHGKESVSSAPIVEYPILAFKPIFCHYLELPFAQACAKRLEFP